MLAVDRCVGSGILIKDRQLTGDGEVAAGPSLAHRLLGAGRFKMVTAFVTVFVSALSELKGIHY